MNGDYNCEMKNRSRDHENKRQKLKEKRDRIPPNLNISKLYTTRAVDTHLGSKLEKARSCACSFLGMFSYLHVGSTPGVGTVYPC